jgi:hypothetical protein
VLIIYGRCHYNIKRLLLAQNTNNSQYIHYGIVLEKEDNFILCIPQSTMKNILTAEQFNIPKKYSGRY